MDKKTFIENLGFIGNLFTFSKEYKLHNYTIRIDLQKEKIFYRKDEKTTVERQEDGQIQIGDHTTSNFSHPENYVVLECVNRLLEKGYAPSDLHLERKWKVGHGASGGKADINVFGKDGKTLLIIECKTWGKEFEKEKSKMEEHGGQLFTYLNQDKNTQFLVLYTSKFENKKFNYNNLIVQVKDRKEDLKKSLKQIKEENIKLYRDAKNKGELFEVWKESFNKYFHFNGIFDADANAYSLELKALKKKNLKNLEDSKGLFNKFAEILRHNNISDNANAFNRVLSLFLCKIVDEEKNDEDILDFQVKEDEEYEHIIDRLQALYQKGMKKLKEKIVYYSEEDLHKIIKLYPKQTPIEKIEDIFRELKYYTNNEFAFKEVHNKKLFTQNARVLVEVIKLLQNYKLRFTSKQQVLGDFFELMLNHGVKQSEGQFFTPIPIVRYIILSLGYENIINKKIKNDNIEFLPKILDYSCGAGHFLTESIEELQQILKTIDTSNLSVDLKRKVDEYKTSTNWAKDFIFGIEKDYRLARTSQIACYINGDGEANIIFGDGLEEHEALKLNKKKFDIVIANPPYSVEAFKNYLNVGKTNFKLFEHLSERSSQIEALFIEQTKQVLADNGLAGIVLPSTILTNTGIYTKAREILLKHFEIKAITELGSKTFIATGTTTVILFLKRRNDDFLKDREYIASDYFNHTKYEINYRYIDAERFLKMFVEYRNFNFEDYKRFLIIEINDSLSNTEMFKEYRTVFNNSTDVKQLQTKISFKNYSEKEKKEELTKRFYEYCKNIEKEKFLYFMLCLGNGNKQVETINKYYQYQQTVIVKTGKEIDEQKVFLGYEFVGRKGQEGIKITNYGGKMFDKTNYVNPDKANSYIHKSIKDIKIESIATEQKKHVSVFNLVDLIDFERINLEKIINTNSSKKVKIESKYKMFPLEDLVSFQSGLWTGKKEPLQKVKVLRNTNFRLNNGKLDYSDIAEIDVKTNQLTERILKYGDIILEKSGGSDTQAIGRVVLFDKKDDEVYSYSNFCSRIRVLNNKVLNPVYLWAVLNDFYNKGGTIPFQNGVRLLNIDMEGYKRIKIPLPSLEIQKKIILEIESIEKKEAENTTKIEKLNKEIFEEVGKVVKKSKWNTVKIEYILDVLESGNRPVGGVGIYSEGIPSLGGEHIGRDGKLALENLKFVPIDFYKNSKRGIIKPNDILICKDGALTGKVSIVPDPMPFEEAMINEHVFKLVANDKIFQKYLFLFLFSEYGQTLLKSNITGQAQGGLNRTNLVNIKIPLPPIDEQKKLISSIEKKEKEIEKLKESLSTISSEKEEILKKYL